MSARRYPGLPLALVLALNVTFAPEAATDPQPEQPRFRTSTSMVLLDVSVTGATGQPLLDLTAEDFLVLEDGVVQKVAFFQSFSEEGPAPASIVLLLDTSSSMEGQRAARSREAALAFIEQSPLQAEIAIAAFDDRLHLVSEFTRDRKALAASLERLEPAGGTALYDALLEAVGLFEGTQYPRQAIVLSTDGADLDSRNRFEDLERSLASNPVSLYAVGQYDDASRELYLTGKKHFKEPAFEENLNPVWVLKRLAELTGGQAVFPRRDAGVAPILADIARKMKRQYVIGYQPSETNETETPRFRAIEVRLRDEEEREDPVLVRARRGYIR